MGVYIYQSGVEKEMQNAYIGEYWNGDLSKIGTPKTFKLSSPMRQPRVIQFKPDGTRFYVSGYKGDRQVGCIQQYQCSTPRDITTASLLNSIDFGSYGNYGGYGDILLANEGQYMYYFNFPTNPDKLYVYSLATPRDINSTKTEIANYSGGIIQPHWMSEDGKAFIWDANTAFYYSTSSNPREINTNGTLIMNGGGGIKISTYGEYLYISDYNSGTITKYKLGIKFDATSTKTQEQQASTFSNCGGICFDTQGDNLYVINMTLDNLLVYQYSLI